MSERRADEFDVFLSYPGGSRGDSEHARQLSDLLGGYGFRSWIAERELGGRATPEAIGARIATVPIFIACIGARRVGRWGMEELRRAADRAERSRDVGLLTVIFPGGDPAAVGQLPAIFSSRPTFDLRGGVTSVAALVPLLWERLDPSRWDLLQKILADVRAGEGPVVLVGPPGVGKSKLADVVLAALIDDFPAGRAFVPIDPRRSADSMAGLIMRMLGIDTNDIPRERRQAAYRDLTARDRYLVVLDDADGYDVRPLVPARPSAAVVVGRREAHLRPSYLFAVPPGQRAERTAEHVAAPSPGFVSDVPDGEDLLDVQRAVAALCSVVAARDVAPPLSIGLFGDWGMGKSFFIRRMRDRVEQLAEASRRAPDSAFFGDIRQIEFNAWRYADANLWASLASGVFEGLADDPGEQRRIVRQLMRSGERFAEAEDECTSARRRAQEAEEAIELAKQELVDAEMSLRDAVTATGDLLREDDRLTATMADLRALRRLPPLLGVLGTALLLAAILLALVAPGWRYAAVAAAASAIALLVGPLRWGAKALRLAAGWQRAAAARGSARELARLQVELDARRAQEVDAAQRLEAARRQVAEAQLAVDEIASGRRLFSFIDERAEGRAYRPYQGVVDLVRRDFERLAALIAGRAPDAPGDLPRIERIVLYIDDLDRCPARRVIEVLEAVHLLLASNLFVVVVAVDPRWLMRALEHHYRGEMAGEDGRLGATARDYLEKIFQVPFALPRMDAAGFGRLVEDLLPVAGASHSPIAAGPGGASPERPDGGVVPDEDVDGPRPEAATGSPPPVVATPIELRPEGLRVEASERDFMRRLAGVIETPRAAKRLTNVYRLLRVSLEADELDVLLGRSGGAPEFPCVQLMLAVVVGAPSLSSQLLARVRLAMPDHDWWLLVDDAELDSCDARAARRLRAGTRDLRDESLPALARFAVWAPHVHRYSYGLG